MSEPGVDPSSGKSSGDGMRLPERHPACRRREARPGFRAERENLRSDDSACLWHAEKGEATSGSNREGESTDAGRRGGAARRSDESSVMELEQRGCVVQPRLQANWQQEEPANEARPFIIPKREVWEAFKRVKANQGAAGVDGQSIAEFEADLSNNLYILWNRLSSGSYFPPPVRRVEIPKAKGGTRPLGIPTVSDRIAQEVVRRYLEPIVEPAFHVDSYGYRPGKSAIDAVRQARQRCWRHDWVLDLDVKSYFESIDWGLMLTALRRHTDCPWVLLYVERWLKAPVKMEDGSIVARTAGTPQGGVISPLLANLFLHYAFDMWMTREFPHIPFERYADDAICHCTSEAEAETLWRALSARLADCRLVLHPEKTQIVYCKDVNRRGDYPVIAFDFLGFQFRARKTMWTKGGKRVFTHSFLPAASPKALTSISRTIRRWTLHHRSDKSLSDLAEIYNPVIRGWINYFRHFYPTQLRPTLIRIDAYVIRWARRKFKSMRHQSKGIREWLARTRKASPKLLAHWKLCHGNG
jgi:RNA-directed DNA polymerase